MTLVTAAPPATAEDGYVDLFISAQLDAPAYLPADTDVVRLDVTVTNQGTAPATGVVVRSDGDLAFTPWGDLDPAGTGIGLAPNESVLLTLRAVPRDTGAGMTQRLAAVSAEPDRQPADNRTTVSAFVTEKYADLTVTVYGDADRDNVVDAGETRSGVPVVLYGGLEDRELEARTDAAGVAHFPGIPGGEYWYVVGMHSGWHIASDRLIKVRGGTNTAEIRATHTDFSALVASVSFDRASYAPGDTVRERVTLTNTGATDIVGVVANCRQLTIVENMLESLGWGELAPVVGNEGVVVRAGETRTWEFTDVVPEKAWEYGFVHLRCGFSPPGASAGAVAEARAVVPGGRGTLAGTLVDREDRPTTGVTLLMINLVSGDVAARAVSDGTGRFAFPELPAELYELRPVGPWRLDDQGMFLVQIMAGVGHDLRLVLAPGPTQLGPGEPPPTTGKSTVDIKPAPTPQASPRRPENLADTGADVVELAAIGALLVLAGAALLLVRRRSPA